jgi:hypothetical protein
VQREVVFGLSFCMYNVYHLLYQYMIIPSKSSLSRNLSSIQTHLPPPLSKAHSSTYQEHHLYSKGNQSCLESLFRNYDS